MLGGSTVLAIAPPATGPPYAVCVVTLFTAYSTASRQCRLVIGATLVSRYMNRKNPLIGLSAFALRVGLDKTLACPAAATPVPEESMPMSPASSRLSMSAWLTFRLTMILLAVCLATASVAGFQFGFGTSVSCLFSA